jgi:single-stranded-DNA-specific exonuclease
MGDLQWILQMKDTARAAQLARALGISPLLAQLMINRGIAHLDDARRFLACDLSSLADPFAMLDMDKAVDRIEKALHHGEPMVVYGDYDVDGQTAAAVLVSVLRELSADPSAVSFYIPNRMDEGYGLHREALQSLVGQAKLVITVDCGITSVEEARLARRWGLDLIITDHHQPGPEIPDAVAVLNPKRPGCPYPEKQLAGVGIAFRLAQALGQSRGRDFHEYLDLVALGTVADLVPLQGENRILAKRGLERMARTSRIGLQALMEVAGVGQELKASHLGFRLGPRLNAAGRLSDASLGVQLLLTDDPRVAQELAAQLDAENTTRQEIERRITVEACEAIVKHELHKESGIVIAGEGWHPGVIGIVASRLVEEFCRPTVVVSLAEGIGTGSARSIAGFDLHGGLVQCSHLLERFGGHTMAAGLTVREDMLPAFTEKFIGVCAASLSEDQLRPRLLVDAEVQLRDVTESLVADLALLEPTGFGNPPPLLQVEGSVVDMRCVGKQGTHLKFTLRGADDCERDAIAFGFAEQAGALQGYQESAMVAFVPTINDWRDQRSVQLQVKAVTAGPQGQDFVSRALASYPWQLGSEYHMSPFVKQALAADGPESTGLEANPPHTLDLRGTWNKVRAVEEHAGAQGSVLILVNTPAEAMEVCRQLRIEFPGRREKIGFVHELLAGESIAEIQDMPVEWLVSTGLGVPKGRSWESVWLWHPPLTEANWEAWREQAGRGGLVVLAFGSKDVRDVQLSLCKSLPDRRGLARIYAVLRDRSANGSLEERTALEYLGELGLERGLWFAAKVFAELGLWSVEQGRIAFLPAPANKLDLYDAVLYNRGMNIRRQTSLYLRECLKRGFTDHGFTAEN